MTATTRRRIPPFVVRLMLPLALTLAAVGTVQYALVAHTVTTNAYQQLLRAHAADAEVLRGLYDGPDGGLPAVTELLDHIAARPGVERIALVGGDGVVLAIGSAHGTGGMAGMTGTAGTEPMDSTDGGRTVAAAVEPSAVDAVAALVARAEEAGAAGRRPSPGTAERWGEDTLVRIPLVLGADMAVLEVVGSGDGPREQVEALREVVLLTLVLGAAVALPLFYLIGGRDISVRHAAALESSSTDALTGLGNHRRFHEQLRDKVQAATLAGSPLTLALLDLDGFKQVNDTHGHRRGDSVLSSVGFVLREGSPDGAAHRVGGDEFALLLPGTTAAQALRLVEAIRAVVERDVEGVTASIGVATLDALAPDAESLVEHADSALYAAKRRGRNQVVDAAPLPGVPTPRRTGSRSVTSA